MLLFPGPSLIRSRKHVLLLLLMTLQVSGATYFVRPGSSGNGASWASAWGNLTNINWRVLSPGDVVCLAGGTYSDPLVTGASGAPGKPITLKRAIATDPNCGSTTRGWNAAYEAQVVMEGTLTLHNSYLTVDGLVPNGISILMKNPADKYYAGIGTSASTTGVTLRYIEVSGPCGASACLQAEDQRSIELEYWTGSRWAIHSNWLIQYVNLHGACNNMVIYGAQDLVVEHSRFADSSTTNTAHCHPNIVNAGADKDVTWRYNEMTNWQVEGIMLLSGNATWQIYGNLWDSPMKGSYPRVLETQDGAEGPVLFYNNTLVNLYYLCANLGGGTWAPGTQARNNIYWNSTGSCGLPDEDYDYSQKALTNEAHGQGSAKNPFLNTAARNYHLAFHTHAGLPLQPAHNRDRDGNVRNAAENWDRGAYQYVRPDLMSSTPVAPPTQLVAVPH